MVFNQNVFAKLNNNCNLVINSSSPDAITLLNSGGNIISENEFNVVKWNISTSTGSLVVPFTTNSNVKIPLKLTIVSPGTGLNSFVVFSTYETATDMNTNYPSDVTNMDSDCNSSNALFAVDRFWRVDASSYSVKPGVSIDFRYDTLSNETGGTNTINKKALKAQRFNSILNKWETPSKTYGISDLSNEVVKNAVVAPADFYKSWTLIDTTGITLALTSTVTNITCNGYNNGSISLAPLTLTNSSLTYSWSNSVSTQSIAGLSPGTYSVLVSGAGGCSSTETFTITEPTGIIVSSVSNSPTCQQNPTGALTLNISGGTPAYNTVWSNGATGPGNINLAFGVYTATVTDANVCLKTFTFSVDSLPVSNYLCIDLFIPELFTPNADGKNDVFQISKVEFFPDNTLSVFNRWGSLVYQKKSYKNEWDGKPNVKTIVPANGLLPAGTYFIVFDFGDGKSKPYNGYVELQY